ncbi:MAG: phospholipase [Alphaproteobacteria bacterium]|nr:phospholipase [Alphaproteobacteria bacterium]
MALLSGPSVPPARQGCARSLVVLLHGWGANGDDLIGLAPAWARALPDAHFVSPHGPDRCDQNPMGLQWFSFLDASPRALLAGAERARGLIDAFLDAELARLGLGDDRLALVGFSQGAMMALHVGLRRARACAAVLGYSGALIGAETLADAVRAHPPILLIHGDADQVVPVSSLHEALGDLVEAGVPAEFHVARGIGHGIDEEGLELGGSFLAANLR